MKLKTIESPIEQIQQFFDRCIALIEPELDD
jgi:hypothetical protein